MTIQPTMPISPSRSARIAIVGEAPGEEEEIQGKPFVGVSGAELTDMLLEAGIVREQCFLTNAFMDRPPANDIYQWCVSKKVADEKWQALGNSGKYPFAPLKMGKYVDPERLGSILRLHKELVDFNPTIIIALGNTPLWALSGESGITKSRGTLQMVSLGGTRDFKLLPTFHPAYILRQYEDRPIVIADLMKAKRESETEDYVRPNRELWLEPSLEDIEEFYSHHLQDANMIAVDIETARGQITCIGFGTQTHSICIPFWDSRKPAWNYWPTIGAELRAWSAVRSILQSPTPKLFQNGMYDMYWLWKQMGMTPQGDIHDTMLLHHSMFPEMKKSLGFLGSIYTNEASWKKLRPKKTTVDKKDDAE